MSFYRKLTTSKSLKTDSINMYTYRQVKFICAMHLAELFRFEHEETFLVCFLSGIASAIIIFRLSSYLPALSFYLKVKALVKITGFESI